MDISKEYIKMCDCPEIQKGRQQGRYEFYKDVDKGRCFVPIWLPRQDQLQGMVSINNPNPFILIGRMLLWAETLYIQEISITDSEWFSMEQLWLAFVMKEKFSKKWNGNSWKEG